MKLIDIAGKKFGRLTVIERKGSKNGHAAWVCSCNCGNTVVADSYNLKTGRVKSCGCYNRELKPTFKRIHGGYRSPEFRVWCEMKRRCFDPKKQSYRYYGGRGIKVCERWSLFKNFIADMGPRPTPKHSIDRIDNDGNYSPENCRWATHTEQMKNRKRKGK